jgi:hypothetical protein
MTSWLASLYSQFRSLSMGRKALWSVSVLIGFAFVILSFIPRIGPAGVKPLAPHSRPHQAETQRQIRALILRQPQMSPKWRCLQAVLR